MFHLGICGSRLSFVSLGSQSGNSALATAAATAAATSAPAFFAFWISPRLWQVRILLFVCLFLNMWKRVFYESVRSVKSNFNIWIERFLSFTVFDSVFDLINQCSIVEHWNLIVVGLPGINLLCNSLVPLL